MIIWTTPPMMTRAFGPPDTQWVLDDGWKRVNTGLTPVLTPTSAGDYVGIDEGNKGTINQIYAVYARTLSKARVHHPGHRV